VQSNYPHFGEEVGKGVELVSRVIMVHSLITSTAFCPGENEIHCVGVSG
jgi:hypothetical protein